MKRSIQRRKTDWLEITVPLSSLENAAIRAFEEKHGVARSYTPKVEWDDENGVLRLTLETTQP